jgi:nucleoside-diphosphate-sugar epimerase
LLAGKEEIRLGSLHPTRDLLFVKDTVDAFVAIAESDKTTGEEINIATNSEISIGDLAQKIIGKINPKAGIATDDQRLRPEKSEVERLCGANQKILTLTNWVQRTTLDTGLDKTIEWFRETSNLVKYKADVYNI